MLVLKRRVGEKLVIGNEIIIEVLSVSGEGVRLGVTAPGATSVHRFEVYEEIQKANRHAAESDSSAASRTAVERLAAFMRPRETQNETAESETAESETTRSETAESEMGASAPSVAAKD